MAGACPFAVATVTSAKEQAAATRFARMSLQSLPGKILRLRTSTCFAPDDPSSAQFQHLRRSPKRLRYATGRRREDFSLLLRLLSIQIRRRFGLFHLQSKGSCRKELVY